MSNLDGKVAIVTGAGRGLGRSHALLLAQEGAQVVVNDPGGEWDGSGSDNRPAQQVVEEIEAAGGKAVANFDSCSDWKAAQGLVQQAIETFGDLNILINNAGILRDKTFQNMTPDLLDPVIDVHLKGAFNVTRPAWIHMREQGYGRVVSTASGSGLFGNFGQSNYAAAKLGIVGLTRVLANEGRKHNIKANAIAPIAWTRMTENMMGDMQEKLDPKYVSPLVAYLVSEECEPTGEVFSVAGGYVARVFIGVTQGIYEGEKISPEVVRDNITKIRDIDGYYIPEQPTDEFAQVFPKL
jgi:NAD(P)-dependent dehydrogenase (short-subunit alcohol dehydrogenase family)